MALHSNRRLVALVGLAALAGVALPAGAATGVSADHGAAVVSEIPLHVTPHVMDGSVNALTQVGDKVIAAGTFHRVSPPDTFADTSDDIVRNGIFAFDA